MSPQRRRPNRSTRNSNAPRPELARHPHEAASERPDRNIERRAVMPLPEWRWKTFPVYFAFAVGLFVGVYVGVIAGIVNEQGNSTPQFAAFIVAAIVLGLGLSRLSTRWILSRRLIRQRSTIPPPK